MTAIRFHQNRLTITNLSNAPMMRLRCLMMILLFSLCSCEFQYRPINSTMDTLLTTDESDIWVSGSRERIYALVAKTKAISIDVTGSEGWMSTLYVLEPPPWTIRQTNRLAEDSSAWQYPVFGEEYNGLWRVAFTMGAPLNFGWYLISIDPLVIAVTDEVVEGEAGYRVQLVDVMKNQHATKIMVLDGKYPVNADLSSCYENDDAKAIRSRTRIIDTNGMTLTDILDSPQLWQGQDKDLP